MKIIKIREGEANILIPEFEKITKSNEVFYNPVMAKHRSFSIGIIKALAKRYERPIQVLLPLAASGVRGVRVLLEAKKEVKEVVLNDINPKAIELIKKNLEENEIKEGFKIFQKDANILMREVKNVHYIDLDPFGSPNPFLDSALQNARNNTVIAITATDTAPLAGTYEKACQRKYWAKPFRSAWLHEIGLRILIRKVQLVAAQYEKAALPLYSYAKDHIYRTYIIVKRSKSLADKILQKHKFGLYKKEMVKPKIVENVKELKEGIWFGPLWTGLLGDKEFIEILDDIFKEIKDKEVKKLFYETKGDNMKEEVFFYDLANISKKFKIAKLPKLEKIFEEVKKRDKKAIRTHFSKVGIKTSIEEKDFIKIVKGT